MNRKNIYIFIAYFIFINTVSLFGQDSIKIYIIGKFNGSETFNIKYNKQPIFTKTIENGYSSDFLYIVVDTNGIKNFDRLPIELYKKKKKGKEFSTINLPFIYQKDRKILILEYFPVEQNCNSFRQIWLDKPRKDILIPEYDHFIWE